MIRSQTEQARLIVITEVTPVVLYDGMQIPDGFTPAIRFAQNRPWIRWVMPPAPALPPPIALFQGVDITSPVIDSFQQPPSVAANRS